ncbi:hypothetical protein MUO65_08275 [bacterium]|nr:hypothetical protein [bacterium]
MTRCVSIFLSFLLLFLFDTSFALTKKDFQHSMDFYQKLVEKKVSVEELIFTLEKILGKYKDIGVNLTPVKEKLLIIKKFKVSGDFYGKLEARGATLDERITALKRILTKFRNIDADLSGMEKKLEQLQKEKGAIGKELEGLDQFKLKEMAASTIKESSKGSKPIQEKVKESGQGKTSGSETERVEDFEEEEFEEFKP